MDPTVRRRVVSAPLTRTPIKQQTRGPPSAYDEEESHHRAFVFAIPSEKFHRDPHSKESTQLYHQIIKNLYQLYVLLVLIWADLTLLLAEFPFHTIYFLSKSTTRNVLISIFQFYYQNLEKSKYHKCILPLIRMLRRLAKSVVEMIAWWYSSWRWEVEQLGTRFKPPHWFMLIISLIGKGSGYLSWSTPQGSSWPFETQEQAFEYLDHEFMDPSSQPGPMTRHLPLSLLRDYFEEKKKNYLQNKPKPSPMSLPASYLRRLFRECYGPDAAQLLIDYSAEHFCEKFPLGYLNVEGRKSWYQVRLGMGTFGPRVWHRVQYGSDVITGIAIGTIVDTSHIVLVVPNGPIYLVWDCESDMPQLEDIPYTITSVYPSIAYIGTEFQFDYCVEDEDFAVLNWSEGDLCPQ